MCHGVTCHSAEVTLPTSLQVMTIVHTYTHTFNGPFSRTTRVGRYQKGKTNLDFTEARETVSGSGISWAYASLHLAPDR